jgi:hypothetical protein
MDIVTSKLRNWALAQTYGCPRGQTTLKIPHADFPA